MRFLENRTFPNKSGSGKYDGVSVKMVFGKYLFGKQQLGNRFLTICYLAKSLKMTAIKSKYYL